MYKEDAEAAACRHTGYQEQPGTLSGRTFREIMEGLERGVIKEALSLCQGNRSLVSRRFGISRNTLYRKIRKYGLA